ncbi:inositol phosphorylceramide synthase [Paenibacillaceae bacterium]|nr:inositol phosphorylceramide synthase [Paenibacillaceae bacterium]
MIRSGLMKKFSHYPLLLLLAIPTLGLIYVFINQEPQFSRTLYTDLDDVIPFLKIFIVPYMIWMPFLYGCFIYFYFKDRRLYYHTMLAYVVSVLICYGIYMVFQTTVPRAELLQTDLLSRMVQFVYTNDQPFNCFPSIHCLSSYLLFMAALKSKAISRRAVLVIGIVTWSIIVSTVFVKQHVVIDVFAGVMLGHLVFATISILVGQRAETTVTKKNEVSAS